MSKYTTKFIKGLILALASYIVLMVGVLVYIHYIHGNFTGTGVVTVIEETQAVKISCTKNKSVCRAWFSEDIEYEINKYSGIIGLLNDSVKGQKIYLHLVGSGGSASTMVVLTNAIRAAKAETTTVVEGHVYSAHAYLSIVGDKIIIKDGALFLFHLSAKGSGPRAECSPLKLTPNCIIKRSYDKFAVALVKPLLTKKEMELMKAGADILLSKGDMIERLEKHNVK